MNLKTFIFMMLTFREIYQIPRNIQTYLSITMWVLIAWMIWGNKATMLNDSVAIVCTCLEYPDKYKMEVININIINII